MDLSQLGNANKLLRLSLNLLFICSASSLIDQQQQATFLTASVGKYVIFNYHLDFPHDSVIDYSLRWYKEGTPVFQWEATVSSLSTIKTPVLTADPDYAGRINLVKDDPFYGRGSVNLTSIRESDGGWYECNAYFPNRSPSTRPNGTWYYLKVEGGLFLAIPPTNRTVTEGERGFLDCGIKKDIVADVTWFKDNIPIGNISKDDFDKRSSVGINGSLIIDPTHMGDLGEYECVASNNGSNQSASAYLNVQYKAKVLTSPSYVHLQLGKPATLDCDFRANPPLTDLRWEKDGFLFDPYNVQGVFYNRNGSLFFSKIEDSHAGFYTCTPTNELGSDGPSPPMRVIVQRPPWFTVTPKNLYLAKLGERLIMQCDAADGDKKQKPTLVWFRKDSIPLPPAGRITIQNGSLIIEKVQESDSGVYQCAATNEAAEIRADTEVMIENVAPRAPYNLSASSSYNSITLRWIPSFLKPKMEYSIWYRLIDVPEWRTIKVIPPEATEVTISNLSPSKMYEVMVMSQDRNGEGMFSKALQITTTGSESQNSSAQEYKSSDNTFKQIGPPRNITIIPSLNGYLVSWEPPEFGTDILKTYLVRWTEGPRDFLYGKAETQETSYFVDNLEEDNTYYFEVTAKSLNDDHAHSSKYVLVVPGYRRVRSLSIGIVVGVVLLLLAAVGSWYVRKRWIRKGMRHERNFVSD